MSEGETKIINFRPPRRLVSGSWRRMALLVLFSLGVFLASVVALNWQLIPGRPPLTAGDTATESVRASRRATYVSQSRTRAARDAAAAQVTNAYDFDSNLLRQLRGRASDLLRSVSAIRSDTFLSDEARRQQIVRLEPGLSAGSVIAALELSDAAWLTVNAESLRILDEQVRDRVRAEDLAEKRSQAIAQINPVLSPAQ
ncbi:MAG TPA: hypothetical protein VNM48_14430, partial [Chloroflexota bacterium]|nr:hypothetical protein [Chloroflexota bacterium]